MSDIFLVGGGCQNAAMTETPMTLSGVVLGAPDPHALAAFYEALLGYERTQDEADWVTIRPPGGGVGLSFQTETDHVPPAWPAGPGDQQMQVHLDVEVGDLEASGARARELGATLAAVQPQGHVRVWADPAGHPFCLFLPD
jgi:catechol 2,3-dioxygenase-like lactoylglutathione lyase family enzyme